MRLKISNEHKVKVDLFIRELEQNIILLERAMERYKKDGLLFDLILASNYLNSIYSITGVLDEALNVRSYQYINIEIPNRAYEIISPKLDEIKRSKCKY